MTDHEMKPIFLIGAGRSGTKFLRSLIGASEYIAEIPYDVGYVWRFGNEAIPHDELSVSMLDENIRHYVRKTLPRLINKETLTSRPRYFVEKSVPNTLRVEYLDAIYPDALFIHLIRDGRAVTESAIRMWKEPPKRKYLLNKLRYFPLSNYKYAFWYIFNIIKGILSSKRGQAIWGPRYKGIDEDINNHPLETVCARQWKKCVEKASEQLSKLSSERVLEVRYEALMKDVGQLVKVCEFIVIPDFEVVIEKYRATVNKTDMEKWRKRLRDDQIKLINDEISHLVNKLGY